MLLARFITIILAICCCASSFAETIKNPKKTVLITGGLTGIGRETALAFQKDGYNVWVTSRNTNKYDSIQGVTARNLDITDQDSIKKLVQEIYATDGRLDVLVNNAGYGVLGPEETISAAQARDLLNVNVVGPLLLSQEALPIMRTQKSGHIINISSSSGLRALPGLGVYAASKMALEGISQALAAEVAPWNIHVTIVEPGSIKNDWVKNSPLAANLQSYPGYQTFTHKLQNSLSQKANEVGQKPQEVAQLILKIANNPKPDLRYQSNSTVAALAHEILIDPSGNQVRDKSIAYARELYDVKF